MPPQRISHPDFPFTTKHLSFERKHTLCPILFALFGIHFLTRFLCAACHRDTVKQEKRHQVHHRSLRRTHHPQCPPRSRLFLHPDRLYRRRQRHKREHRSPTERLPSQEPGWHRSRKRRHGCGGSSRSVERSNGKGSLRKDCGCRGCGGQEDALVA